MTTYVYGLTDRSHPALRKDMTGVGDPPCPVRVLAAGDLAAVVSDTPEDLRPKRRDLLAHQNVLAEVGAAGAVLPMRFGSLASDDDAVTAVLDERADHYRERLRALDGKVEYNVKAYHLEDAVMRLVMADNAEIRSLAEANRAAGGGTYEDKLRLGEMVAVAVQAREAEDAAEVVNLLQPESSAVSVHPQSSGWLLNASFLVPRDAADDFLATVEKIRGDHAHLELRINGPLPPYSFVEPGSAQPADTTAGAGAGAQ